MGSKAAETAPTLSAGYLSPIFGEGVECRGLQIPLERRMEGSYLSTIPSARHGTVS